MKIQSLLEAAGQVGRKYQHIEDLVIANGSHGAMHAVERLSNMIDRYDSIELKWDGMPVVYWGRDDSGTFYMIPKNAWQYLKSGTMQTKTGAPTLPKTPQDVMKFILGTGGEADESRVQFAKQFASLWPYLEKASPKRGFLEGGLLFYPGTKPNGQTAMPIKNEKTNTYDFKPNITAFHVPIDSKLGQRIASAKVMIAATGYYDKLGSSEEGRYPNAESLSTTDTIVQGTTYVEEMPGVDTSGLDKLANFIQSNAQKIDNYLAPKPGMNNPGGELYTYLNQHLRTSGLLRDFPAWAQSNLSAKKAQTLLSDPEGLKATLGAVEAITNEKTKVIKSLSLGLHGGIMQTNPEGYVQAHPEINFKYALPGQFLKLIDQLSWQPRKL
jgi:hypothetical protein